MPDGLRTMFFFGTMRDDRVREAVTGRTDLMPPKPAALRQHAAMTIDTGEEEAKEYPTLQFDPDGEVDGVLVGGLTPNDLARIEYWEDGEYGLATMRVHDEQGFVHEALVYATSIHRAGNALWTFAAFQKGVPEYLDEVRSWMVDA